MAKSKTLPANPYGSEPGKLPPQAVDIEEMVLGALILESHTLIEVIDILNADTFYKESHQRIYSAIVSMFSEGSPIDMGTLTNHLRKTGELERIGGASYIMELTSKVNFAANIEFHARILSEAYIKRKLITLCAEIQQKAYEDESDAFVLLDEVESELFKLAQAHVKKNYVSINQGVTKALQEIDNKKLNKDSMPGVPSGFSPVDKITAGFQKGELYILAARPGMGKTAFLVSAGRNAAVEFNKTVGIFSLEMSTGQLVNRMISAECEIDGEKLRRGQLSEDEWEKLHKNIHRLSSAPIFLDDTVGLSILELRAKCRRMKAQHNVDIILIDYLQLMTNAINGKGSGNREQEISQISRALKNLAKELDVPVIALSQLSRSVESRGGDKRPMLSDLRESGSIEQDADVVIFLYRPEYYGITEDEEGNSLYGVGEVIIEKNRNGSVGNVKLKFVGKYTKFQDPDVILAPEIPFNGPVSLDKPVESFIPGKQNEIFHLTPNGDDPDF